MIKNKVPLGNYITPYSVKNKNNEDIPVYSVTNSEGFCRDYFSKEVASKDKTTYKIVPKGCFAYNPSRINVGSIDWQREEERVIVSPLYNVFSISEELDAQFLYYYLKSDMSLHYIKELASGSVRDNLKLETLMEFPIPELPLAAQKKISSILDNLTEAVSIANLCLGKLDQLVKSRFVEMFGDPTDNPMGWDKFPLGKRCNIITGNTPPRANAENYGTFIEWIKSDNINTPDTYLTVAEEYLSEKGFEKCRYVEAGSVLMTCIAGSIGCIGNVAVADRRVAFNQQINAIVPVNDETLYVFWLMQLSKPYIQSTINMALKGILSKGQLSVLEFPFPPMLEQTDFAAFVQEIDKSKLAVKECLEKAEYLKSALMQEYFG